MPIQIGVDAWNLPHDRRGIGRYVREVVRRWAIRQTSEVRISLLVPEWPVWLVREKYVRELGGAELAVRHRNAARSLDAVWYPWNGMSWDSPVTSIATLHDASLFAFPPIDAAVRDREQRPFRVAAAKAVRVITSSEFSRTELVRYLGLDPARVEVVHLGVNDIFESAREKSREQARLKGCRYVLFVGEPEERKSITTLFEAMALLPPLLRDATELVIVGATGRYPLPEAPRSVRLRNVGWVEDAALARLYAEAAAFVFPSRYEGFGLPVVEAMAAGAPVIAADSPGVREAGGQAALYVSAGDATALGSAIASVLSDRALAKSLTERGVARAGELSWDETARRTLEVVKAATGIARVG